MISILEGGDIDCLKQKKTLLTAISKVNDKKNTSRRYYSTKMQIKIDDINRIHMIDEYKPYGSIIFDLYKNRVGLYQDSGNPEIRTAFEDIEESAEFEKYELIDGLKEVIEILEGKEWQPYTS